MNKNILIIIKVYKMPNNDSTTNLMRFTRCRSFGLRHIAQKAARRHIRKTLDGIAPPNLFGNTTIRRGKKIF